MTMQQVGTENDSQMTDRDPNGLNEHIQVNLALFLLI